MDNKNTNDEELKVIEPNTVNNDNNVNNSSNPSNDNITNTNDTINSSIETPPLDNTTPNVVNTTSNTTNEVNKVVVNEEKTTTETKKTKKNKQGHPIFLFLLIIFLFAFVFFLPDITNFINDYKAEKTGANELKSGKMSCTMTNTTNNLNYTYDIILTYEKNRLKESTMTTTSRLSDNATDSSILTEKQDSCLLLKNYLDENNIGMKVNCNVTAALQTTEERIDYRTLDLDFISSNIAEFEGFYPEYELDESVSAIETELTNSGYTCTRTER